jgi:hypothetical protein
MGYQLDGYFATQRGIQYLNDVVARFLITFKDLSPQRLHYKPKLYSESAHYYPKIYALKELQSLKSLKSRIKAPVRADSFEDYTFWAIKLYCEDLIRAQGIVNYYQLEDWSLSNFERKERSTLRAKCKSIFNWYEKRNWALPNQRKTKNDEELLVTRAERSKANAELKAQHAKKKVVNAVTGLMASTYRKKSGAWHIGSIAKDTGLTEKTVSKYLKELKENGTIV